MNNELIEDRAIVPCLAGSVVGEGLKNVRLCPWGIVESKRGTFLMDAAGGRAIVEAFEKHETPIVIDWEHQTLGGKDASPTGRAPAAGWIRRLWVEKGMGLYGLVEWLDEAREAIRAKAYQFLSPVLAIRKADGRVMELHSVGLTNKPAIPALEPLAASVKLLNGTETIMPQDEDTEGQGAGTTDVKALFRQLAALVGIEPEGKVADLLKQIIEKVKGLLGKTGDEVASKAVIEALGAKEGACESELLVAINTLKQGSDSVADMKVKLAESDAEDALRPHIEAGKINPNDTEDVEVCRQLAMSDRAAFDHQMARRLPNPPPGKTTAPPRYGRHRTIAQAVRDYARDPELRKTCDAAAYVGLVLREAGLQPLSDDETREHLTA